MRKTALQRKTPLRSKRPAVGEKTRKSPSIGNRGIGTVARRIRAHSGKKKTHAALKKELDAVFSKFIRYRDQGQCFTCPKKDDPKRMQCGHFVPRQYLAVRYDERNCNCQCYACNMLYGGQGATYAIRLAQKYDQVTVQNLEAQRWVSVKLEPSWFEEKIKEYQQKLEQYL